MPFKYLNTVLLRCARRAIPQTFAFIYSLVISDLLNPSTVAEYILYLVSEGKIKEPLCPVHPRKL